MRRKGAHPSFKVLAASYSYLAKRLLTDPNRERRLLSYYSRTENSGPEGEELRTLVIKEAIRVTEANTIGTMVDTYNSIPAPLKTFIPNGNGIGTPLTNA